MLNVNFVELHFLKTYVSSSSHCLMLESRFWWAGGCGQKETSVFKTSRWQWQYSALSPLPDSPHSSCLQLIFPSLIMAVNCGWFTVSPSVGVQGPPRGHCSFKLLY